jgi:NADH:ubiquinone oxidoreductase subunit K
MLFSIKLHIGLIYLYSFILIFFGLVGILTNRNNFIIIILFLELIFLGFIFNLSITGLIFFSSASKFAAIIYMVLAAGDTALSLGLYVSLNKVFGTTDLKKFNTLSTS